MVIDLMQVDFCKGHLVEECACQNVVLNSKGNRKFCGIGLVEVLWKIMTGILNNCLTTVIQFHETLHGLHMVRSTGAASLEANLLQNLMDMREGYCMKYY